MQYILIAAWFVGPDPVPVPFQAEFTFKEACVKAEGALNLEWSRSTVKGRIFSVCVEK